MEQILLNVGSVDAFQGDEREYVFASLTRSNEHGELGFLPEERRIGLMIGRGKKQVLLYGDMDTLVSKNNNPTAKTFFEKMKSLIAEHGTISKARYSPPRKRRTKKK